MAQQNINLGSVANDGTGDSIRLGGQKIQANFTELYTTKLDSVVAGNNVSIDNTDPINPIINVAGLPNVIDNQTSTSSSSALSANQGRLLRIRDEQIGKLFTHGLPQISVQGYLFPVDLSEVNQDGTDDIIALEDFGGNPGDPHYILISKTGPFDYLNLISQFPGNILRIILYEDYYATTVRYARGFKTTPIDLPGLDSNYYAFEVIEISGLDNFGAISHDNLFGAINCVGVDVSSTYTFTNGLTESGGTVSWYNQIVPNFFEVPVTDGMSLTLGSVFGSYGVNIAYDSGGVGANIGLSGSQIQIVSGGPIALDATTTIVISSDDEIDIVSDVSTFEGQTFLGIITPNVFGSTATPGQVLTLIDEVSGEVEFQDVVHDIVEGTNISIDKTDPFNPIINVSGLPSVIQPTGLEAIDEGNGIGWRLIGKDAANFGNTGLNAVDLGYSSGASSTRGATGLYSSIGGGDDNTASGEASSVGGGSANESSGSQSNVSGGLLNIASGDVSNVNGGANNVASGSRSNVSGGGNNTASGDLSAVSGGTRNEAPSYGEWVGGLYSTVYTPASTSAFNAADRLFNIGNGTGTGARSDAFTIFKNGSSLFVPIDKSTVTNETKGMYIYDTVDDEPKYHDGTSWNSFGVSTNEGQIEETASFSLDNTYNQKVVIINNGASAVNITVPTSLSNGFKCGFIQRGTGVVTFVASSTTLNSANGLVIDGQYNQAYIEKRNAGTNELFVLGNLTT